MKMSRVGAWSTKTVGVGCVLVAFACSAAEEKPLVETTAVSHVPSQTKDPTRDPFFGEKMRIHVRRTSANVRFTLFEGGHEGNFDAGIDWLARQRRGQPVDWTLPETASGSAAAVTK